MDSDQLRRQLAAYLETVRRVSDKISKDHPPSEDIRRRACSRFENQARSAEVILFGMFTEVQRRVLEIGEGDTIIQLMNADNGIRAGLEGWVDHTVYPLVGLAKGDLSRVFEDDSLWWVTKVLTQEGNTMFLRSAPAVRNTTYHLCIVARALKTPTT